MLCDAKFCVLASTVVAVVASFLTDVGVGVGVAHLTQSDARCENGQILEHGIVLEVDDQEFVLDCDDGFEASPSDAVKCRDGVVVIEESARCVPVDTSPSVTIRKIRSPEQFKPGKRHQHLEAGSKRHQKQKDDGVGTDADADAAGRRKNRRKMLARRRKVGFQADEGASAVPGEAVQWRSYGNDVVGEKDNFYLKSCHLFDRNRTQVACFADDRHQVFLFCYLLQLSKDLQ